MSVTDIIDLSALRGTRQSPNAEPTYPFQLIHPTVSYASTLSYDPTLLHHLRFYA